MANSILGTQNITMRQGMTAGSSATPAPAPAAQTPAQQAAQPQASSAFGWGVLPQDPTAPEATGALQAQQAAGQAQLALAQAQAEAAAGAAPVAGQGGVSSEAAAEGQSLAEALSAAQQEADAASKSLLAGLSEKDDKAKTLVEMMKEAREEAEALRKKFTLPKNGSRYSMAAVQAYAKLSRARSQADVSAAASYARRQLIQCKNALRQDPDNSQRIQAAVRQLQSAVARASRKKRDLETERLDEVRRTNALRRKEKKKAAQLKNQLNRKRISRALRENGYLNGAVMDGMQQAQIAKARAEQQEAFDKVAGSGNSTVSASEAAQRYLAAPTPPLAAAPAADAAATAAAAPAPVQIEI